MTQSPQGRVDRLFVPPNVTDAISMAVFNGRAHGDACMHVEGFVVAIRAGRYPEVVDRVGEAEGG